MYYESSTEQNRAQQIIFMLLLLYGDMATQGHAGDSAFTRRGTIILLYCKTSTMKVYAYSSSSNK